MAQGGIKMLQHEAVLFRVSAFDSRFLSIRFHITAYQGKNLRAVVNVRLLHVAAQSCPVFRFVVCPDDTVCKVVQLPDVLFKCGCTPDGQLHVMFVGTFRRSETLQPHRRDGNILVVAHGVYSRLYFAQLDRVAAVIGINHRLINRKVDVCRAGQ